MSLLGEERKSRIMEWLEEEGKVMTKDLIERLDVSGETVRRYLEELERERQLKRVTNSLMVASHLEQCRKTGPFKGEIRLLGGTVDAYGQTVGVEVLQALDAYAFDACFLSFDGAEIERGFVSDDIESSLIQKAVISCTKDVYAFLANDEFQGNRKYKVAEFRRAKIVLSPASYPPSWEMKLFNERVNWMVVS